MSIEAREWVTHQAPPTPTDRDRVVLDVLADIADAQGRNVWPSRETIAWRAWRTTSESGTRKVSRALAALKSGGWIMPDDDCSHPSFLAIRSDRRPQAYRLNLDLAHSERPVTGGTPQALAKSGAPGERPVTGDTHDLSQVTERPVTGDTQTVREPEGNREGERAATNETTRGKHQPPPPPQILDELAHQHATRNRCAEHAHLPPGANVPPCYKCRDIRQANERRTDPDTVAQARRARREARAAVIAECSMCDEYGWRINGDGSLMNPAVKCDHDADESRKAS